MYHNDLSLYTTKNFRSFNHINHIWDSIETTLFFYIGILENSNITIIFDPGILYITITSNYVTYCSKKIVLKNNHLLNLCKDFSIEINILLKLSDEFNVNSKYCSYYYCRSNEDEGIVEMNLEASINGLSDLSKLKEYVITSLVFESQYAINKIFIYNSLFESKSITVEIDSYYEFIYAYSKLKNISFNEATSCLMKKNMLDNNSFYYTKRLHNILQGKENEE